MANYLGLRSKTLFSISLTLLIVAAIASCSTKRNTAISRAYHRTTARFNFYFNAEQAYNAGVEAATTKVKLDYARPLPFILTGLPEAATECGSDMDRSIEKCAALIRLHSITAKPAPKEGKLTEKENQFQKQNEFNPWARKAWLLMGKARLWNAEYELSQQALEFTARQFKDSYEGWEAQLWLARLSALNGDTLAATEKMLALDSMATKPSSKYAKFLFAGIYADLLTAMGHYEKAKEYGEIAAQNAQRGNEKTRCRMALAALYEITGNLPQARREFSTVAKKANSYEMSFNAKVKKIAIDAKIKGRGTAKELEKMLHDEKNIDFFDQIYYALGEVTLASGDTSNAMTFFQKAASASTANLMLKGSAFLRIANHHLAQKKYLDAAQFYDSALASLPSSYANYETLFTRGNALGRLGQAAQTIAREDSLQRIAMLPEEQRVKLIDNIIENVKEQERLQQLETEKEQRDRQFAMQNQYRGSGNVNTQNQSGGDWYFYNPATMSFGRSDFKRRWGSRKLEDNWRRKNRHDNFASPNEANPVSPTDSTRETDAKKREFYLQNLPQNDSLLAISNARIIRALRQMGDVYRYDLNAFPEAIERFETLAARFANRDDAPEALYFAYLTAQEGNLSEKMEQLRASILSKYPESSYAHRLIDPNYIQNVQALTAQLERLYDSALMALSKDRRDEAKLLADQGLALSRDGDFATQFELLIALASGKTAGSSEQLQALKAFAAKRQGTPQALYAQDVLASMQRLELQENQHDETPIVESEMDSSSSNTSFKESGGKFWVTAAIPTGGNIQEQKFSILSFCVDWNVNLNLEVFDSPLNDNTTLLTVKTFDDENTAQAFANDLDKAQPIEGVKLTVMPISPDNFNTMVEQKSFSQYLAFYRKKGNPHKK